MSGRIWAFAIYWGVWLIIPMLIDGFSTLVMVMKVWLVQRRKKQRVIPPIEAWPGVTIIIPVYNGQETLGACLRSVRNLNYPPPQIEVLVVDNGSTDNTSAVFEAEQLHKFRGQMHWLSIFGRGKAYATNAGIHLASHQYICNLDADTVLHPNAIQEMVRQFEANPTLGAATGTVEVLPVPVPRRAQNRLAYLIGECEFQEYLEAFWLGRQSETITEGLFTLAGAFSFFRRGILFNTLLYDKQTVSEDTKITFDVRQQFGGDKIACVPEAIVYLAPTPSLSGLYAQRVRWQRGQLEVAAIYQSLIDKSPFQIRGLSLSRMLLIDHTLIFPRLIWVFLFPTLFFFGYPLSLIVSAILVLYLFYMLLNATAALTVYLIAPLVVKKRLEYNWWMISILPLYRFAVSAFRLAGSIIALAEPAEWCAQSPWQETINALKDLWSKRLLLTIKPE